MVGNPAGACRCIPQPCGCSHRASSRIIFLLSGIESRNCVLAFVCLKRNTHLGCAKSHQCEASHSRLSCGMCWHGQAMRWTASWQSSKGSLSCLYAYDEEAHLQEELGKWRERSTAPHFLTAAAAVQNLAQTLPQLIHHKVLPFPALLWQYTCCRQLIQLSRCCL